MVEIIREILSKIISDIDAGNSNITEEEAMEVTRVLKSYTDKNQKLSKYQACRYLNVSRATFDNYVREGFLPKGIKEPGFKEVFWEKKSLDIFINSKK